jgi:DNA modification methylase
MMNEIWQGDVLELAKRLPDNSIHMICTSPPYWNLRDYGTALWVGGSEECNHVANPKATKTFGNPEFNENRPSREQTKTNGYYKDICPKCSATRIDQQLGLEKTPEEYIEKMVLIFRELRRALREDGTLWLNLGDGYAQGNGKKYDKAESLEDAERAKDKGYSTQAYAGYKGWQRASGTAVSGLKPKDLIGMPWRIALALQADGWYLRSDIIWAKKNCMPESVNDRPTKSHEYVFLLTKSARYFYDAEAIREATGNEMSWEEYNKRTAPGATWQSGGLTRYAGTNKHDGGQSHPNGRNRRTVWTIATEAYPEAHFATYPEALVEPCILAGTSSMGVCPECGKQWERVVSKEYLSKAQYTPKNENLRYENGRGRNVTRMGDGVNTQTLSWQPTCKHTEQPIPAIILDPFLGSGTTASVAKRLGRNWLGFELNPTYIKLAWKRIDQTQPPLIVENDIVISQEQQFEQLSF